MSITVKWNSKKFHVQFPLPIDMFLNEPLDSTMLWPKYFTLHDLKKKCYERTGVPIKRMKLLKSGATMKDDKATLESYGIQSGSKILMLGSVPKPQEDREKENTENSIDMENNDNTDNSQQQNNNNRHRSHNNNSKNNNNSNNNNNKYNSNNYHSSNQNISGNNSNESSGSINLVKENIDKKQREKEEIKKQIVEQPLHFLETCLKNAQNELEPLVHKYSQMVDRHPKGKPITKELEQCYLRASELLMQNLLNVDQVMAGQNEEVRIQRKKAVKLIQGLIDTVDKKLNELKAKI